LVYEWFLYLTCAPKQEQSFFKSKAQTIQRLIVVEVKFIDHSLSGHNRLNIKNAKEDIRTKFEGV